MTIKCGSCAANGGENKASVQGVKKLKIDGFHCENDCWAHIKAAHKNATEQNRWKNEIYCDLLGAMEDPPEDQKLTEKSFEDKGIVELAEQMATTLGAAIDENKTMKKNKFRHPSAQDVLNLMEDLAMTPTFTIDLEAKKAPRKLHPQFRLSFPENLHWKVALSHMLVLQTQLGNFTDKKKKHYETNSAVLKEKSRNYYAETGHLKRKEQYEAKTAWVWDGSTKVKELEVANRWRKKMVVKMFTGSKRVSTSKRPKASKKAKVS